ncbi:MAG: Fe-S cluster assembly protein SufD [Chloroflexi bacterium RBG_19FT_COMBO_55_16]|nr:MAG: Fe-S cluster assembly protein SufD [Chloroflexi bacterium RBG_19FT_COMBO_55_16]
MGKVFKDDYIAMARTVVTRTRNIAIPETLEFNFTADKIPTLDGGRPAILKEYRARAWDSYKRLSFPKTTDEPWRRTDLRKLDTRSFHLPEPGAFEDLPVVAGELLQPLVSDQHGGQIILLPGGSQVELSTNLAGKGVIFSDLATAEREHSDVLAHVIGQIVRPDEGKFAALAASLTQNGVLIYVPRGVQVEQPLHSVLWGPGVGLAHLSHVIVWLEEGASLTYVHEAASPTEPGGQTLHAGIVEIHVGDGAQLRFVELQSWGEHVWNFSHERARVGRDANLDWVFVAVGSHLTKNFSDLDLNGQGATGRMSGFYFADGTQHLDHDTQQNHLAPNTTSDLLFKGALKGHSRSVWQGMIYVAPGAQKTDGYQANRNLVLSSQARADSIPGLEIMADDVRCTHGATVGKINPEEVFYLRSRGIPNPDAERLIVEGFFDPIVQRVPFEGVRSRLEKSIAEKMG